MEKKKKRKKKKKKTDYSKIKSCDRCDYSTKYGSHMKLHKSAVHEGVKRFGCDKCNYRCSERNKLGLHKDSVHGDVYNFHCDRCGGTFKIKRLLVAHKKMVHEGFKKYKCDKCLSFATNIKSVLEKHVKLTHLNIQDLECLLCSYKTGSRNLMVRHERFHKSQSKVKKKEKSFQCDAAGCAYKSAFKQNFNRHVQIRHLKVDLNKYKCDKCNKSTFASRKKLQDHVDFKHDKNFQYICDICNVPKQNLSHLNVHKKAVHDGLKVCKKKVDKRLRRFSCEECQSTFCEKRFLATHVKVVHQNIKDQECSLCSYTTGYRHVLLKHQKMHAAYRDKVETEKRVGFFKPVISVKQEGTETVIEEEEVTFTIKVKEETKDN